jgi:16S rRNA (adenine1518-N6/adenine1519-N6)-dimethyltransferase
MEKYFEKNLINKNHKAKKSLGQNFLKSNLVLNTICNSGEIKDTDTIVEIGPGKGALTEKLLEKSSEVVAIEKDRDLIPLLKEKFQKEISSGKLTLIEDDCLFVDISKFTKQNNFKIIANIPYNITGAILKKFLSEETKPKLMVLLVQYEVAKRIVSSDKKESILSLSVKAYGEPKYIMKVSKKLFSPSPKVDSAVITIKNIKNNFADKNTEKLFFEIIKNGFLHKRKILIKNLENFVGKTKIENIFNELNLPKNIRAENLPINKWVEILNKII